MTVHPTLSDYYRRKFGCKVYKLALDAGGSDNITFVICPPSHNRVT